MNDEMAMAWERLMIDFRSAGADGMPEDTSAGFSSGWYGAIDAVMSKCNELRAAAQCIEEEVMAEKLMEAIKTLSE